jgi:SSS family solute:Na+ symporter
MNLAYGTPIDYVVIAVYFVAILGFGSIFGRYTRTTRDFFFSGQRFAWWLISFSCVATVVGSYSFIKYSEQGYNYGLSSTMTYLNDWFLVPLFIFGWLPLVYFSRVVSIPEYFEKRFNRTTRLVAVFFIMLYMVGYIGINLYTLGVAIHAIIPTFSVFQWATIIAVVAAVYCTFGGQTAVIMTDLVQGVLLLLAGFLVLFLGLSYLGAENAHGLGPLAAFWEGLPEPHRYPFSGFARPERFPMAGIFWQDFFGSSMFFYFANQGLIMRFLAAKSVDEGRKAIIAVILILMPMAAIAVSGAGWVGRAMTTFGLLPQGIDPNQVFVVVTERLCDVVRLPGMFGFVIAALTAALMSTVDTLINAASAIMVNDLWKPLVAPDRSDRHYLGVARVSSIVFTLAGLSLVPVYMEFKSIYLAHASFTAAISPPIIVAVILGMTWRRFSSVAAVATLTAGGALMALSIRWPVLIKPLAALHGMDPGAAYHYMRALFGFVLCSLIGVAVSLLFPNRDMDAIRGLWIGTIQAAKYRFKGRAPNDRDAGRKVRLLLEPGSDAGWDQGGAVPRVVVSVSPEDADAMRALEGDLVYVADKRWWLGGLRSLHATLAIDRGAEAGRIRVPEAACREARLAPGEEVVVERIL